MKSKSSKKRSKKESPLSDAKLLDDKVLYPITIEDITEEGEGIGHIDGMTVFVHNALPGDHLLTKLIKVKKRYAIGIIHQMLERSENRITAPCPYARQCGGCQLQEYDYAAQLSFKENHLIETLKRIGGIETYQYDGFIGMASPEHYRNKGIYQMALVKSSGAVGFYRKRSHDIVDVKQCMLQTQSTNDLIYLLRGWIERSGIAIYNEKTAEGILRRVMVRDTQKGDAMMVVFVVTKRDKTVDRLLAAVKAELPPTLKSVYLNYNADPGNTALSYDYEHVYGDPEIIDTIGTASFKISPQSFFQINRVQTERLYDVVVRYASDILGEKQTIEAAKTFKQMQPVAKQLCDESIVNTVNTGAETCDAAAGDIENAKNIENGDNRDNALEGLTVLDLYCGIGSIGIYLAKHNPRIARIIGVEVISNAIEDARVNAAFNGLENTEYHVGKAEAVMPMLKERGITTDLVILDPPRKGCDEALLSTLVAMAVQNIIYVSCKPSTLARDLKYLTENGFIVQKVTGVDMFPWTGHVETVVRLQRQNP
jgi:23S rRNA (uracil1939-C5)-methyltransferase